VIRWNWNPDPSRCALLDLETQSAANLKEVGGRAYLSHESTRLLSAVAMLPGRRVCVWVPEGRGPRDLIAHVSETWLQPEGFDLTGITLSASVGSDIPEQLREAAANHTFVAHNAAGFDAFAWERFGLPAPAAWCDTVPSARAAGLPGGLDALGKVFLGRGKDEAGSRALRLLYTVKRGRDGAWNYPVGTVALWKQMLAYNVADVLLLERVWREVRDYGEADVLEAHSAVNARGIHVDLALLDTLLTLWDACEGEAVAELEALTGGELHAGNMKSVPQVMKWVRKHGFRVESLNRQTLERVLADPEEHLAEYIPDDMPEDVLAAARETGIAPGDVEAAREMVRDAGAEPRGRVAAMIRYARDIAAGNPLRYSKLTGQVIHEGDARSIKGFDDLASQVATEFPDILGGSGVHEDDTTESRAEELLEHLRAGVPEEGDTWSAAFEMARGAGPRVMDRAETVAKVVRVLRLRQQATKISKSKLERLRDMTDRDSRVRDVLVYHAAHTGRWTGRGFQPHNLPRGTKVDVEGLLAC